MKTETVARFILNCRYHLRIGGAPKSKWRKLIGASFLHDHPGNADVFVATWEMLEDKGLI